jgi:hypothetical protein
MSQQWDDTNKGTMSRNDNKTTDKQPDFKGFINVEGEEYWLSGWVREAGPNAKYPGKKFFSLAVTKKDQQAAPVPSSVEPEKTPDFDDDVPW